MRRHMQQIHPKQWLERQDVVGTVKNCQLNFKAARESAASKLKKFVHPSQSTIDDDESLSSQSTTTSLVVVTTSQAAPILIDDDDDYSNLAAFQTPIICKGAKPSSSDACEKAKRQRSILSSFTEPYGRYSAQHRKLTSAITHYIYKDGVPAYAVEKECFKAMIAESDRRFYMPPEDPTSENLKAGISGVIEDWGLDEAKLTAISTDNAASIIKACRDGGRLNQNLQCAFRGEREYETMPNSSVPLDQNIMFGHHLNLAVVNALMGDKAIDEAISSCQKVTTHFAHSHKKSRLLEAAQEELHLPKHHLLNECPTRWGSKLPMINRFLEQECAVKKVLSADKKHTHLIPTGEDLATLEAIRSALEHVAPFTDMLSGEDAVTISLVQPTVILFNKLLVPEESDVALTRQIKSSILEYINKHHQHNADYWQLLSKCSFLDPRFKATHNESVTDIILHECEQLAPDVRETITLESATTSCTASAKHKSWGAYLNALTTSPALTTASVDRLGKEVSLFTSLPTVAEKDSDPLTWWSQHETSFPCLAKLAKKYLCIQA
ncbi:E3 SUMO-protein ligase ZBED1-like [Watersipora subatra]|uniref:E3 SUMO-protein ligase ZBED1-like n=1 Tax=Watersipora subatra TaxID=2589382 RepID=UPI00355BDB47